MDELEDDYGLFDEPVSDNQSTHSLLLKNDNALFDELVSDHPFRSHFSFSLCKNP